MDQEPVRISTVYLILVSKLRTGIVITLYSLRNLYVGLGFKISELLHGSVEAWLF